MNKIYQVIWNRVRNCYVVVSELARRDGKGTLRRRKAAAVVTAGTLGAWLLALGTGVSPALAAEPAAGIIQKNQYVGFKAAAGDPSGKNWVVNGATYNRVRVDGQWWWVREGYVVSSTEGSKYTPLSQTGEHYDVSYTGSGNQPADILAAVSSLVSASGTATNAGESLNRISASAFEGVSTGGGTGVAGGRVFAGDDGETVTVGFGETMQVTGGQSDTSKLTTGNIGVVKDGGAGLSVRLSSELTGLTSVSAGNSTMNNDGFTVQNGSGAAGIRVTGSGITIAQDGDGTHAVEISNSKISVGGQQIHEIAAGTAVTDAVNVGQLNGAMENVSNTIGRLGSRVDRVGAGSAALAALHPLEYDPDDKFNVAAGFGHYRGANAAAIGAFFQPDERVRLNLGGSMGGGENMLNAGITFSLDPVRGTHLKSRTALTREVQQLRTDNQTLREDNQKVHEQLAAMSDQLNKLSALVEKLSAETEAKP